MIPEPTFPPSLDELMTAFDALGIHITAEREIASAKLGELRRQAKAWPHRRGGSGSADTRKYAIGGAVVLLAGEIDATTFLGLLAQTDMMLKWMADERLAHGPRPFGDLLRGILADGRKAAWCRRWGELMDWAHRKVLYDASVTSFEASGRTGEGEPWRRDEVTDDQADLVETLCRILDQPLPDLADRGAAYEWIKERGGNPAYWQPPAHPESWRDDDDARA